MKLINVIDKTVVLAKARGYTEGTWKHGFRNGRMSGIRDFFKERDMEEFDVDVVHEYIAAVQERYDCGAISYSRCAHLKKMSLWLIEVYETGELKGAIPLRRVYDLNSCFKNALDGHLSEQKKTMSAQSVPGMKSEILVFLEYLQDEKNHVDFHDLTLKDVQDSIEFICRRRAGRVDRIIYTIRYFLIYLKSVNLVHQDLTPALYLPAPKQHKVLSGFTREEVERILMQPDRNSPVGKRDYAILLTGVRTGLRIGDIVNLEFANINWKDRELNIRQGKTSHELILPLEVDVLYAIADYVQNARPKLDLPYIFLRHNAPHRQLSRQTLTTIFIKYRSSAKISHTSGDGKSFHGLRRSLATWMLEEGVPLPTISQFLGHRQMNSAQPYLSFDEKNLKACALSFRGIELSAEELFV